MDINNLNLEVLIIHGNKAFHPDNWSHEVKKQIIDYVDQVNGIYIVGCTTITKVFLKDGRIHEAIGFKESHQESFAAAYDDARNGSFLRALHDTFKFFKEFQDIIEKLKRLAKQQELQIKWKKLKSIIKNIN